MEGNDTVTMFTLNKYITLHLVEKLDRSAYTHDEAEAPAAAADEGDDDDDDDEDEEDSGSE